MIVTDTKYFMHQGRNFVAKIVVDETNEPPWSVMDSLGSVTDWTRKDPNPGQKILITDKGCRRYYNHGEAIVKCRGEGIKPADAHRFVNQEYDYFRSWCNDEWHYVGVIVFPITARGDELRSYRECLWGIESNATDHINEAMINLADDILASVNSNFVEE